MTKEKTKFYLNEKLVEANADETIWQVVVVQKSFLNLN